MINASLKFKNIQLFQTDIVSLSHEGRGIANVNGKTTFLRGGLPGETVEFTYLRKHRSFDEGQVVQVLKAAPDRVVPPCPHFGVCGGCALQHIDSDAQILFKQSVLLEQLQHIGGVQPKTLLAPLKSQTQGYRYKARLGVKYVHAKHKVLVGFREINGRYLADIQSCAVLHPKVGQKIEILSELVKSLEAYQSIPQIEVAAGDNEEVALIFRHLLPLSSIDQEKLMDFGKRENMSIYLQPGGVQTIHCLWPSEDKWLSYSLEDHAISLRFQPSDFTQVNPYLNRQMVNQALTLLAPQSNERILDLFCGLGNFTLPFAKYCHQIVGIEGDEKLVQRARENAQNNNIFNANFYAADLTRDFSDAIWAEQAFDKILLDPPRTGALETIKLLSRFNSKMILYVSCNPATLARDAAELIKQGYQLTLAGVMDMFPHTAHVEAMALFQR